MYVLQILATICMCQEKVDIHLSLWTCSLKHYIPPEILTKGYHDMAKMQPYVTGHTAPHGWDECSRGMSSGGVCPPLLCITQKFLTFQYLGGPRKQLLDSCQFTLVSCASLTPLLAQITLSISQFRLAMLN